MLLRCVRAGAIALLCSRCGGSQLLIPNELEQSGDRLEIEQIGPADASLRLAEFQVTLIEPPDGRVVESSGGSIVRWSVSVEGAGQRAMLQCEAHYGAPGKDPMAVPDARLRCEAEGMKLEVGGKGQRPGQGEFELDGVDYVVEAIYDVDSGEPPAVPAGYSLRLAFNVMAAAEAIAPADPGAVILSRHVTGRTRAGLMVATVALLKFTVSAV
jgi:hypothetical protein